MIDIAAIEGGLVNDLSSSHRILSGNTGSQGSNDRRGETVERAGNGNVQIQVIYI